MEERASLDAHTLLKTQWVIIHADQLITKTELLAKASENYFDINDKIKIVKEAAEQVRKYVSVNDSHWTEHRDDVIQAFQRAVSCY